MNKGNINITVSGGSGDFRNIVQGDGNNVSVSTTKAIQDFYSSIADLQADHKATKKQVDSLKQELIC